MLKILAVCPNPTDATSFYRGVWPLARLREKYKNQFQITVASQRSWVDIVLHDVIFLQRPFTDTHYLIAKEAKNWGKPVWIDYDDHLYAVPKTNPAHNIFENDNAKNNIKNCCDIADIISVSTESLKTNILEISPKAVIEVIPNGIDDKLFPFENFNWESRNAVIAWRGGNTHEADVSSVLTSLIQISEKHPEWNQIFIGHDFPIFSKLLKNNVYRYIGKFDTINYMRVLKKLEAPIHIVPLEYNDFNECKSNIAWLEATFAGSVVIAPDMPEWRKPGIVNYQDPSTFADKVSGLIKNVGALEELHRKSLEHIKQNYLLTDQLEKRKRLIKRLVS